MLRLLLLQCFFLMTIVLSYSSNTTLRRSLNDGELACLTDTNAFFNMEVTFDDCAANYGGESVSLNLVLVQDSLTLYSQTSYETICKPATCADQPTSVFETAVSAGFMGPKSISVQILEAEASEITSTCRNSGNCVYRLDFGELSSEVYVAYEESSIEATSSTAVVTDDDDDEGDNAVTPEEEPEEAVEEEGGSNNSGTDQVVVDSIEDGGSTDEDEVTGSDSESSSDTLDPFLIVLIGLAATVGIVAIGFTLTKKHSNVFQRYE